MKKKPCPNEAAHTDSPYGSYASTYDWAQMMLKTHVQKQCPDCGLWKIWEPKRPAALSSTGPRPSDPQLTPDAIGPRAKEQHRDG